jgi:hypothetical protein
LLEETCGLRHQHPLREIASESKLRGVDRYASRNDRYGRGECHGGGAAGQKENGGRQLNDEMGVHARSKLTAQQRRNVA